MVHPMKLGEFLLVLLSNSFLLREYRLDCSHPGLIEISPVCQSCIEVGMCHFMSPTNIVSSWILMCENFFTRTFFQKCFPRRLWFELRQYSVASKSCDMESPKRKQVCPLFLRFMVHPMKLGEFFACSSFKLLFSVRVSLGLQPSGTYGIFPGMSKLHRSRDVSF